MECIDFDGAFARYLAAWMREHEEEYDAEEMEDMAPDLYLSFIETPADWLDGLTPIAYFERYDDAEELVHLLLAYITRHMPVPDLLLERIVALGEEAPLIDLLCRDDLPEAVKTAISLLREMQSVTPMQTYIDCIAALDAPDEKGDLCAEALLSMGDVIVEPVLRALPDAKETGRDIFADLLSNFPGDERIVPVLIERFEHAAGKRALFASCLAKAGDARALPSLRRAAKAHELRYIDFMEIANAIEVLGGERPAMREFSGDPDYESLRKL